MSDRVGAAFGVITPTMSHGTVKRHRWWYITSWSTNGATSGSFTMTVPGTAGQYEFRYFDSNTFGILAHSAPLPVGAGFSVKPTQAVSTVGSPLTAAWTAGTGRLPGDYVCLFPVGTDNGQSLACSLTKGQASGTATFEGRDTPGVYEVRYITRSYVNVAVSTPITLY